MQAKWNIIKNDSTKVKEIAKKYNISEFLVNLILNRKIEDIDKFLDIKLENLEDPYNIKDMDKFVKRVDLAIKNKEKVCIFGDYDVDGVTSTYIMCDFLSSLGLVVTYYLPNRISEGYGLNKNAIDKIKEDGVNLIITVDLGITCIEEANYCKEIGVDLCITDHHKCPNVLPDAIAVVNTKRDDDNFRFKYHAGVGIAFKCIVALAEKYNLPKERYMKYLDIVALGTISDIVPLVDENRVISKYGLDMMNQTENIGLKALIEVSGIGQKVDSMDVSFALAPRINACGRMGDAYLALELLLEKDVEKAKKLAEKLNEENKKRQEVETEIFNLAVQLINASDEKNRRSIILYDQNWHSGVLGIVASRLVSIYSVPVILLSKEEGKIKGSGRCDEGMSLYDLLDASKEYLSGFGGHALAAGVSIEEENIPKFKEKFNEEIMKMYPEKISKSIDIDLEITKKDLTVESLKDIIALRPYGKDNPEPIFLYKNLIVDSITTVKDEKHLKLVLRDENTLIVAMAFSMGDRRGELVVGDRIDVIGRITLNTYMDKKTIQIILKDFKKV